MTTTDNCNIYGWEWAEHSHGVNSTSAGFPTWWSLNSPHESWPLCNWTVNVLSTALNVPWRLLITLTCGKIGILGRSRHSDVLQGPSSSWVCTDVSCLCLKPSYFWCLTRLCPVHNLPCFTDLLPAGCCCIVVGCAFCGPLILVVFIDRLFFVQRGIDHLRVTTPEQVQLQYSCQGCLQPLSDSNTFASRPKRIHTATTPGHCEWKSAFQPVQLNGHRNKSHSTWARYCWSSWQTQHKCYSKGKLQHSLVAWKVVCLIWYHSNERHFWSGTLHLAS